MLDGKHQGSAGARAATGTSTARRRPPSRAVPASSPQIRPGATPRRNTRCNTWLAPAGPDPRRRHRRRGHLGRIDTHGAGDRPRVRIGRNRWINLLWLPQIGFAVAARIAIPKEQDHDSSAIAKASEAPRRSRPGKSGARLDAMEDHDGHRQTGVAAETRAGQLAASPRHDDRGRRPRLRPTLALARQLLLDIALARPNPRRYAAGWVHVDGRLTRAHGRAPDAASISAGPGRGNSPPRSPASRARPRPTG
jgi:hypothetical protein